MSRSATGTPPWSEISCNSSGEVRRAVDARHIEGVNRLKALVAAVWSLTSISAFAQPAEMSPSVGTAAAPTPPGGTGAANPPSADQTQPPQPPSERQLKLSDAIAQALKTQPNMRQALAQTKVANARVQQARSGYLPQVTGTAAYQRTTGNFVTRPGATPSVAYTASPNFNLYDYYNLSITASQLIYDFGQTNGKWSAAETAVQASQASEKATRLQTITSVETAFFQAWAERALVDVATEALTNQTRHLAQIDALVKVGIRPEIDLAQSRANVASARAQLINTQNAYEIAKDQLRAAMGMTENFHFEVADEEAPAVDMEDGDVDPLLARAYAARPDIVAFDRQYEAQVRTIRALRGGYGPSLVAATTATEQGTKLNDLVPNWNVGVTLTWPILQGGLTAGQIREAEANLEVIAAQRDALKVQLRTTVDQSRLAVRAAKASMGATEEALLNARQQLTLAEGRYGAGVGSAIELADAQVAYTTARAQVVQARFSLSSSRAQLATAIGLR